MKPNKNLILTINGGSSSIKFAVFDINTSITRAFYGAIERIGMNTATISFNDIIAHQNYNVPIKVAN